MRDERREEEVTSSISEKCVCLAEREREMCLWGSSSSFKERA